MVKNNLIDLEPSVAHITRKVIADNYAVAIHRLNAGVKLSRTNERADMTVLF